MRRAFSAALLAFAFLSAITTAPAYARKKHPQTHSQHQTLTYDNNGRVRAAAAPAWQWQRVAPTGASQARMTPAVGRASHVASVVGGRPAGCPRRFCGCGASLKLFGRIIPELNLASNWLRKFPRTAPAPNMAAARPGHVMVLLEHMGGDQWKVYDANSGGGRTRIHVRSIRGFAVVNPHTSVARL
ncbi:MAG TPA: hypothetical protein VNR11_13585 [Xanthobacteraceae bacterium]|nr:hypothetical protein [Xanthobacteraceae bacterium]